MRRIFPLDLNSKSVTWRNYSNYLNWTDSEIQSISNYLDFWQPSFNILNESLIKIDILSNKEVISSSVDTSELFFPATVYPVLFKEENDDVIKEKGYYTSNIADSKGGKEKIRPFDNPANASGFVRKYYKIIPGDMFKISGRTLWDVATCCFVDEEYNPVDFGTGDDRSFSDSNGNRSRTPNSETWSDVILLAPPNAKYLVTQEMKDYTITNTTILIEEDRDSADHILVIEPNFLPWRHGVYNPFPNVYASFAGEIPQNTGINYFPSWEFNKLLKEKKVKELPASYVLFAKKWASDFQYSEPWPIETQSASHYFYLSQSYSPLYGIQAGSGKLYFKCWVDGPGVMGSSFLFNLENTPSRYYATQEDYVQWDEGAKTFQLINHNWVTNQTIISSAQGYTWVDNFPLFSSIQAKNNNIIDDFFVDHNIRTQEINVENNITLTYNIDTNEDGLNTLSWPSWIRVAIL